MEIMQNKVTRRVALGTIATGLAGATAAAIVFRRRGGAMVDGTKGAQLADETRALQHLQESARPPEFHMGDPKKLGTEFAKRWDGYVSRLGAPISETGCPADLVPSLAPPPGGSFRLLHVVAAYSGSDKAELSQPPSWYHVTSGQILARPPLIDDRATFLLKADNQVNEGLHFHQEVPGDQCLFLPRNGGGEYFSPAGGQDPKRPLGRDQVNIPCFDIGQSITLDYPKGPLAVGTTWTVARTPGQYVEMRYKVAGYANVGRWQTVKIAAQGELDLASRPLPLESNGISVGAPDPKVEQAHREAMKRILAQHPRMSVEGVVYLALDHGLVVRREQTVTTRVPGMPEQSRSSVDVAQMFSA